MALRLSLKDWTKDLGVIDDEDDEDEAGGGMDGPAWEAVELRSLGPKDGS